MSCLRKIKSHNNKELQDHLLGVHKRCRFNNDIIEISSIFHDLGKVNINFQNKLNNINTGYSNHSYLSLYLFFHLFYYNKNIKLLYKDIVKSNPIILNIISNLISSHHGDLKNIDNIINENELLDVEKLINNGPIISDIEYFLSNFIPELYSDIKCKKFDKKLLSILGNDGLFKMWTENSLANFYDTLFNFSQLIESDKRDASNNDDYDILENLKKYNYILQNNIKLFLSKLKADSELNLIRLNIRNEAEQNLVKFLDSSDNRMFELTSPTGSGKTFMMLKLASIIQERKGDYGILMCLPFTSIIDQTSDICENDLLLDVLNFSSTSETSKYLTNLISKFEENKIFDIKEVIDYNFGEETFDKPFIITTFVQFFQSIISNKNSVLIKMPNLAKRIFLIDEFQSIPSSLYTFYYGLLQYFCEKYDCYCILSTATMPNFELNDKKINEITASNVFKNYKTPKSLINPNSYYESDVFNRYIINNIGDCNMNDIKDKVENELSNDSILVIFNTVKDSLNLFELVDFDNKYLLNSNFTMLDKINIINNVKNDLKNKKKVLLVTTQIVEAGVDIDFPIVYRDLCPLPSLIQSSGRCNRNNKMIDKGVVNLFKYYFLNENDETKYSCDYIYDKFDTNFVSDNITNINENELFKLQKKYYNIICNYKTIGRISDKQNLTYDIYKGRFEDIGNFKLIEDNDTIQYYVGDDDTWIDLKNEVSDNDFTDFNAMKYKKIKISSLKNKIMKNCVNVRSSKCNFAFEDEIYGIRKLSNKNLYNNETGLLFDNIESCFI